MSKAQHQPKVSGKTYYRLLLYLEYLKNCLHFRNRNTQFTMGEESNGKLVFLDTLWKWRYFCIGIWVNLQIFTKPKLLLHLRLMEHIPSLPVRYIFIL